MQVLADLALEIFLYFDEWPYSMNWQHRHSTLQSGKADVGCRAYVVRTWIRLSIAIIVRQYGRKRPDAATGISASNEIAEAAAATLAAKSHNCYLHSHCHRHSKVWDRGTKTLAHQIVALPIETTAPEFTLQPGPFRLFHSHVALLGS
jgi:hypothetical protein